jgi:hypothetical protein
MDNESLDQRLRATSRHVAKARTCLNQDPPQLKSAEWHLAQIDRLLSVPEIGTYRNERLGKSVRSLATLSGP